MTRKQVYNIINTERDYQDKIWSGTQSSRQPSEARNSTDRTIDEFALYIHRYGMQLVDVAATTDIPDEKLEIVRKVAALCVACGERHGLQPRNFVDEGS